MQRFYRKHGSSPPQTLKHFGLMVSLVTGLEDSFSTLETKVIYFTSSHLNGIGHLNSEVYI